METLLLMSIIWATFVFPALAARHRDPVKGVRRMIVFSFIFIVAYYFYVAYGHTKYFMPAPDR